ncbi:methyltransferase-like 26 isoform X2 [Anabrus simplex]|uniref:methyltransferase-like 26 isoform X2 n=1 Tax=Anabrus simplex TaxID=316456 RepID=UPI0034DD4756
MTIGNIIRSVGVWLRMSVSRETSWTSRRPSRKHCNSAAERNKDPILEVLKEHIKRPATPEPHPGSRCLEISSGSGQHIVHFAAHFPWVTFQPSEYDMSSMDSIAAYVTESGLRNVNLPIYLNVCDPFQTWGDGIFGEASLNYVININMMHISPYSCTEGLFKNVGRVLKPGGILFTYGPYAFNGKISPESNVRFDVMLRTQDPEWGLRDVSVLEKVATQNGLRLTKVVDMPANNKVLIWKKD